MDTVEAGGLSVAKALYDFMNDEALPETGIAVDRFWDGLGAIIRGFAPRSLGAATSFNAARAASFNQYQQRNYRLHQQAE